jgi:hypothetical protein
MDSKPTRMGIVETDTADEVVVQVPLSCAPGLNGP